MNGQDILTGEGGSRRLASSGSAGAGGHDRIRLRRGVNRAGLRNDIARIVPSSFARACTLICVNHAKPTAEWFDVGVLPTPKDLILKTLEQVMDKEKCLPLLPALGGLSLREVGEVARLTFSRDKTCTPAGLMKTRKSLFHGTKGITLVDTNSPLYWPRPDLAEYVVKNKEFFLNAPDPRLRPKGLLLKGQAGTGKTEFSRWIATQWGCPLYRLDATVQSKYVG